MCLNDAEECVIIYTSDLKDEEGDRKWVAMSECMDRGEDKEFGKKLLALWMEQIQIVE